MESKIVSGIDPMDQVLEVRVPTEPALKPGDFVEVVNDAIGVLAHRVVAG